MVFLLEDGNWLFTGSLILMLMIAVMEGVMTLIGAGISSLLDTLVPDFDVSAEGADAGATGGLSKLLGWLRIGEVPMLILLVVFLLAFGVTGLLLQMVMNAVLGFLLPTWLIAIPVFLLALPQVRLAGGLLGRHAVGDETEAVGRDAFIGKLAVITIGEAKRGCPAEARLRDEFGTTHYLMVEPDGEEIFVQGDQVLVVEERGSNFRVIRADNEYLMQHS